MEILYLTAVLAIIALCIALFSTARRVMHATPLTNGDLSITQMERLTNSWEPIAQQSFEATSQPIEETESEYADEDSDEENLNMEEYLLPQVTPAVAATEREESVAPAMQATMPELPQDSYFATMPEAPEVRVRPESILEKSEDSADVQPQAVSEGWMDLQPGTMRKDRTPLRRTREDRMENSSPSTSHYLLECLLIGISVLVLVKTQKSATQYSSQQSSHRVA